MSENIVNTENVINPGENDLDMEGKIIREVQKASNEKVSLEDKKEQGRKEVSDGIQMENFVDNIGSTTENIKSIAEETLANVEVEEENELEERLEKETKDPLLEFAEEIKFIRKEFEGNLPESIKLLYEKSQDTTFLGEEVKKVVEFMNELTSVEDLLETCRKASMDLPDDILISLMKIMEEAKDLQQKGSEKVKEADLRERKINEILDNTKKNLEPMQRTILRNQSSRLLSKEYGNLEGTIASNDLNTAEVIRQNASVDKITGKIAENMRDNGRTEEEIAKAIQDAKDRINEVIAEEKERKTETFTTPSSYINPLS